MEYRTGNPGVPGNGRTFHDGFLSDGIVEHEFLRVFIDQENRARLRIDLFERDAHCGFDQSIEVDCMEQRLQTRWSAANCVFS